MYGAQNSLGDRLSEKATIPKVNLGAADRALREAHGEKGFQIKGASTRGNVVQVGGLAAGTTAEDVKVCTCTAHSILVSTMGNRPHPFPATDILTSSDVLTHLLTTVVLIGHFPTLRIDN